MGDVQMLNGASVRGRPPLIMRWDTVVRPLPVQPVRAVGRRSSEQQPPPFDSPFDFSAQVSRICNDIAERCPELNHVHTRRILFGFTQARNGRSHGLQARVTPMRFRGGQLVRRHRGINYQVQRFVVDNEDMLYLMTFCLPRFLNQSFDDKLVTLFHELYHISPQFDGDLRRHAGRYAVHSRSQRRYDQHMARLARAYLRSEPDPKLHAFLRLDHRELRRRHGRVVGVVVPRPKLVPVVDGLF
jgi:predicted metallopeptidase